MIKKAIEKTKLFFLTVVLGLAFLIAGCCSTKPDTGLARPAQVPELPANLAQKAESLPPLEQTSLGYLQLEATKDDAQYNDVSHQLNTLIDAYNCVKTSLNNKTNPKECFK